MNKRQAKKQQRNENLLCGCSYREDRKIMREFHEHEISKNRSKVIPDDYEILVELGLYTKGELLRKMNMKLRWRQIRKFLQE